ncbi:unnamed protein product [Porites evermanni]|uniref:Uncharacterized protein n=1 Tax=Porites evermanni TaxID=104178 RepID=A0ABN8S6Q2_9CNID|nr:unnamed protein product [Porites evermanni]
MHCITLYSEGKKRRKTVTLGSRSVVFILSTLYCTIVDWSLTAEDNIPFPSLANHIVLSKFWKVYLDRKVISTDNYSICIKHGESFLTSNKC